MPPPVIPTWTAAVAVKSWAVKAGGADWGEAAPLVAPGDGLPNG